MTKVLTKMTVTGPQSGDRLESLVKRLSRPPHPVHGRRAELPALPDNIVCFQRRSASELNRPGRGRALHHRFVLIFALHGAATIWVDDQALRLDAGEGLLVFPFQFHHYVDAEPGALRWLYITFELAEAGPLAVLRFRPFELTPEIRALAAELVASFQSNGDDDVLTLFLGLLLARLRRVGSVRRRRVQAPNESGVVMRVNVLAQRAGGALQVRDIAAALGISSSHLRERFRASCGVSLGRHLRRLRLEKACGLLRLTSNRVSEIAEQCGFNSVYSFSRAFRDAYGLSPLDYRRGGEISEGRRLRNQSR